MIWFRKARQENTSNCTKYQMKSNFIEKNRKTWKVELTAGGRSFAEANVQRGLFQGFLLLGPITITIHNCVDAILPHPQKMHR